MHPIGGPALGGAQVITVGSTAPLPAGLRARSVAVGEPAYTRRVGRAPAAHRRRRGGLARGDRARRQRGTGAADARRRTRRRERCSDPVRDALARSSGNRRSPRGAGTPFDLRDLARERGQPHDRGAPPVRRGDVDRARRRRRPRPRGQRDRGRPLHRRHLRLGGQRTGPRPGLRSTPPARSTRPQPRCCRPPATTRRCCCWKRPTRSRAPLASYLGDIQPAYTSAPQFQPVRGVYNHGWLIGDETAISLGHTGRNRLAAGDQPSQAVIRRSVGAQRPNSRHREQRIEPGRGPAPSAANRERPEVTRRGRAPADGRLHAALRAAAAQPHREPDRGPAAGHPARVEGEREIARLRATRLQRRDPRRGRSSRASARCPRSSSSPPAEKPERGRSARGRDRAPWRASR